MQQEHLYSRIRGLGFESAIPVLGSAVIALGRFNISVAHFSDGTTATHHGLPRVCVPTPTIPPAAATTAAYVPRVRLFTR
jgi:hypothetical protein